MCSTSLRALYWFQNVLHLHVAVAEDAGNNVVPETRLAALACTKWLHVLRCEFNAGLLLLVVDTNRLCREYQKMLPA
jgi:hypothetical protein